MLTNRLPNSAYILDNKPYFEIFGEKYKHEDPDSQEEIWIQLSAEIKKRFSASHVFKGNLNVWNRIKAIIFDY